MLGDFIHVSDSGRIRLNRADVYLWGNEKSVVEVKGWVTCLLRERGKIVPGSRRSGHNVWTNTGREYSAMLQTLNTVGTAYRADHIAYMGVGTGLQTEDPAVTNLLEPVAYSGSLFLAEIDHSITEFPLRPARTTVRYTRLFGEDEITTPSSPGSIYISELGLFTDGNQNSFAQGGRDRSLTNGSQQSPAAYKQLFEPVQKTQGLEFEVAWEIRY